MKFSRDTISDTLQELLDAIAESPILALTLDEDLRQRIHSALTEADVNAASLPSLWRYCTTIPMTPALDLGYDPVRAILKGVQTHTVRRLHVAPGRLREVTIDAHRSGIVLRFGENWEVLPHFYTTDDFALASGVNGAPGLSPGMAMRELFARLYSDQEELQPMTCNSFTLEAVEVEALSSRGMFIEDLPEGVRVVGV